MKPIETADYEDRLTGVPIADRDLTTVLTMFKKIKDQMRILADN